MRKLLIGSIISGALAALPLMAFPPAPAISSTPLLTNISANTTSSVIDVSRMVNGAIQVCSTDAPGATVFTVEIRLGSQFPWYQAAVLNGTTDVIPLCSGAVATKGYITMPLATQMRVEVSGYVSGHIFANYGERAF